MTKHVVGEGGGKEGGVSGQSVTYIWAPPVSPWQGWCGLKHTGGRGWGWEGMRRHTRAFIVHSVLWGRGRGFLNPEELQPPFAQDSFHLPPFSTAMPTAIGRGVGTGQTPLPTAYSMAHARSARRLIGQTGLHSFSARTQLP